MTPCRAVIRVRVPDRPGALGLVASRIGAVKADIVGIEIVDRHDGTAVDQLAVVLPDASLVPAVERELAEVDGATVIGIEIVDAFPEPRLDEVHFALAAARARDAAELGQVLSAHVDGLLRPSLMHVTGPGFTLRIDPGDPPVREVPNEVLELVASGITVTIGRTAPLTPGERALVTAYCELVDALWLRLPAEAQPPATPR